MDYGHLRLFKDIALTRSVSRGAALNTVSQSAASQHLQDIESELGVSLLDRSTRPLIPTQAGLQYLDFCRDVLNRYEEFLAEIKAQQSTIEGVVRVASIYSVGLSELSQLEREFVRRHPHASLAVEYLRPEKVYESVLMDHADLGLVSYPEASRQLTVVPWREEEMVLAVSPYHPLSAREEVAPYDLENLDFVGFDEDLPIRREIDRFLKEHHVRVNMVLHFDNIQMIKEAVAHGAGASIVPARILETEISQGRLLPIPILGELMRPIGIVFRRKKQFHGAAKAFFELLQEHPKVHD